MHGVHRATYVDQRACRPISLDVTCVLDDRHVVGAASRRTARAFDDHDGQRVPEQVVEVAGEALTLVGHHDPGELRRGA